MLNKIHCGKCGAQIMYSPDTIPLKCPKCKTTLFSLYPPEPQDVDPFSEEEEFEQCDLSQETARLLAEEIEKREHLEKIVKGLMNSFLNFVKEHYGEADFDVQQRLLESGEMAEGIDWDRAFRGLQNDKRPKPKTGPKTTDGPLGPLDRPKRKKRKTEE